MLRNAFTSLRPALTRAMGRTRALHTTTPALVRIGEDVPDFTQESTHGPISFHEWLGDGWGILFSHPRDNTPVCTTELGEVQRLLPEFTKRNTKVLALSIDSVADHEGWVGDISATQGCGDVEFPLLADMDMSVSKAFDMIDKEAEAAGAGMPQTIRSVFVIGPDKKLKLSIAYPASTGRNFGEILRVLDSLQLTANHSLATPVNWTRGDDCVIVPSLSDAEAEEKFPGFKKVLPYLRMTPDPLK